jgi:hypothetical protein
VASVTIDRVDALRRHIADAVTQTSGLSTLPEQEQDRILEQACGEACELLRDWLASQQAVASRAAANAPLRDFFKDQPGFADFLSPLFADALKRAAGDSAPGAAEMATAREAAARAVKEAAATARRHPRMRSQDIFEVAVKRVRDLQGEVCKLADQLRGARLDGERVAAGKAEPAAGDARHRVWRRKALKILKTVGTILLPLSVSLALSVGGPRQAVQNASAWTNAARVVIIHDLAAHAQPGVRIAPPHAGPQVR